MRCNTILTLYHDTRHRSTSFCPLNRSNVVKLMRMRIAIFSVCGVTSSRQRTLSFAMPPSLPKSLPSSGQIRGLLVLTVLSHAYFCVAAEQNLTAECVCPAECECSFLHSVINCANRNLSSIPYNINSCSWPGVTLMQV